MLWPGTIAAGATAGTIARTSRVRRVGSRRRMFATTPCRVPAYAESGSRRKLSRSELRARPGSGQAARDLPGQVVARDARLLERVAVAQRHRPVVLGLVVDRQ